MPPNYSRVAFPSGKSPRVNRTSGAPPGSTSIPPASPHALAGCKPCSRSNGLTTFPLCNAGITPPLRGSRRSRAEWRRLMRWGARLGSGSCDSAAQSGCSSGTSNKCHPLLAGGLYRVKQGPLTNLGDWGGPTGSTAGGTPALPGSRRRPTSTGRMDTLAATACYNRRVSPCPNPNC